MSWAFTKTGLYSSAWKSAGNTPGSLKPTQYVSVSVLETVATALLAAIKNHHDINQGFAGSGGAGSYTQTVYTKDLFYSLFSEIEIEIKSPKNLANNHNHKTKLSSLDLDVLVRYLSRDRPRLSVKGDTIKINLSATSYADISMVTEQDRAVANLRQTVHDAVLRIDGLSARIAACDTSAKEALASTRSNAKTMARYALRSRKLASTTQVSALDMLEKLEQTLMSIDNASSAVDVMASLRQGVGILASLNQAVGGAEKVAELVDELNDAMADNDEIGREISSLAGGVVDEDALEEELQQMLLEEQASKEQEEVKRPSPEQEQEVEQEQEQELSVEEQLKTAPKPPQTVPESDTADLVAQLSQIHIE